MAEKETTKRPDALKDGRKFYKLTGRNHDGINADGERQLFKKGEYVPLTDDQYKSFRGSFESEGDDNGDANQVKDGSIIQNPSPISLTSEQLDAENNAKVVGDPHDAPGPTSANAGNPTTAESAQNAGAKAPQSGGTGPTVPTDAAAKTSPDAAAKSDPKSGSPTVVPTNKK